MIIVMINIIRTKDKASLKKLESSSKKIRKTPQSMETRKQRLISLTSCQQLTQIQPSPPQNICH